MKRAATLLLLALLVATPALADVVHLKNGGRVEGTVKDLGDKYRIDHRYGSLTVPKADVTKIEKKASLKELYEARRKKIDAKDPDALVKIGLWLREQGWESQALKEFRAALKLDAEHRGAHKALGHVLYEGKWRTEAKIMELRGFVKHQGKWVSKEEKARLEAVEERERMAKERKKAERAFQRKLASLIRDIAYGSKKKCDAAYEEIKTIATERKIPGLAKYAGEVKAYFDRYWTLVRRSQSTVTTEVRASMSKLKRPIPTFTTSLGALSTPVTLQLPELAVVSVKTTVVIPAGRGLP
jgi:tetratricopeptide (TPR) repeat protein